MVNNPYFYSTMGTAPSTQIADSSDNPHSGLIKGLSVGMTGNYAIKAGNNFAITVASASTVNVNSGVVFRNGAYQAVAATSSALTLGTASANSTYSLVVVNTSNVLAIRTTSATNAVPAYTLGDIPVALLLYTNSSATMEIQFLTTNQTANSFTAGYDDSGFTEGMTISADADRTMLKNKGATRDVRVILGDDNVNAKFEVYQDADSDGDEGDNELFSIKASSGEIAMKNGALIRNPDTGNFTVVEEQVNLGGNTLTIGAASQFSIVSSSSDMIVTNTVADKDIKFIVNDADGTDTTATLTCQTAAFTGGADDRLVLKGIEEVIIVALSDETTDLTTGDGKAFFNMPFAMTLTGVKATVNTAPAGSIIKVDIEEAGSTILTNANLLSIDANEKTSLTAAQAAVIGGAGPALANDAEIKFNIDAVGSSTAGKGLKVTLYGYRT